MKLIYTNSVRGRVWKPGFTRTLFHIIQVTPYYPLYVGTPGSWSGGLPANQALPLFRKGVLQLILL